MAAQKKYPADFVERVRAEYPDWPDLHRALENGGEFVGRYLDDSGSGGMSPSEVVKMIDQGKVQELRDKADKIVRRKKLYSDWGDIAQKMFHDSRMRA